MQTLREQSIRDLAAAESKRIDALMLAESRRLDAQLTGQQSAVALAAEKATAQGNTLSAQIQTATSINSAAINELREAHEKRLSLLEQNQYQGVGAAGQRTEGRQQSQWAIGIGFTVAGLLIGIAVMVSHFIK
jgi:hypothetical protein